MKQVIVSIGNTNNKLTQQEWSQFVTEINEVMYVAGKIHFFGGPPNHTPWQNVAWIAEVENFSPLKELLTIIRKKYNQDSVMILSGDAEFI